MVEGVAEEEMWPWSMFGESGGEDERTLDKCLVDGLNLNDQDLGGSSPSSVLQPSGPKAPDHFPYLQPPTTPIPSPVPVPLSSKDHEIRLG
jgi:hypothetical protein